MFEFQPATWARQIGTKFSVHHFGHAVKQHSLDANVIVEVFDVFQRANRAGNVGVFGGRTMG